MRHLILIAILSCIAGTSAAADLPAPVTDADYRPVDPKLARLGQLLFYDPILSGNRTVACATCHHPNHATADGVSLAIGDGGIGLGPDRRPDPDNMPEELIPRNATALFNLGAREFTVLFHDGRVEERADHPGLFRTPLGEDMLGGFDGVLSAQTMFPVISPDEMAGHYAENDISKLVRTGLITGPGGAWDSIAARVRAIPAYMTLAHTAIPETRTRALGFPDISNAIAAFIAFEWRADNSPFDAFLRGEGALPPQAARGSALFYGKGGCGTCHAGAFLTDHRFHAMGVPQFGPGKAARFESHARDLGRARVTGRDADAYAFRTPSLRNVARTAPYGHDGAYAELSDFVAAHIDPVAALAHYDRGNAILAPIPDQSPWRILDSEAEVAAIAAAVTTSPVTLSKAEVADIVAFLGALTDPGAIEGRLGIPATVPSGLPVDR